MFSHLSLIVFDFDGVFTDNAVYVTEDGQESVRCVRSDGLGVAMLRKKTSIPMLILSTETNKVVQMRGDKLKLPVFQGCGNKANFLHGYLQEQKIAPEHVLYLGDDINDLEAMLMVGRPVCPADANPEIKKIAKLVLSKPGGHGAVRELCDLILQTVS